MESHDPSRRYRHVDGDLVGILVSGKPGELEARLRSYDGGFRWFLFRVQPLRDELGNIVRWYGTNTDIDDLQKLGNAARAT